jgi:hypothetical protein
LRLPSKKDQGLENENGREKTQDSVYSKI